MKDYESKNPNKQKDLEALPMAVIDTPDATSDAGTSLDGPPSDGEGCESVTVIIIATDDSHGDLAARSVRENLYEVDGEIKIVYNDKNESTIEMLTKCLPDVKTERIVLMYDNMIILNPVTIYEIGCRRGLLTPNGVELGEMRTPHLMRKSVLCKLLPYLKEQYPYADIMLEYDNYARPGVAPVIMREWNRDNWLLPVVSASPAPDILRQWAITQRFMFIETNPWPQSVLEFLNERFPA